MTAKDVAIVIPARNEAKRIRACLTALAGQLPQRVRVVLVVNNTSDATEAIARQTAPQLGLDLDVLTCELTASQGVGTARRLGCAHALAAMPALRYLLSTDADCVVAEDWLVRNLAHLSNADAVCGKIAPIEAEAKLLDGMDRLLLTQEGSYRQLVQAFYARHAGCPDILGTHGEAAGASLALTRPAYLAAGGFEPMICGEDRSIIRTLRQTGHVVRHADDVQVRASCRLTGRAIGGMSDALKQRMARRDYLIDDCLPPAAWLIQHAQTGTLGPWPPQVPPESRVNVRDVARNIRLLEGAVRSEEEVEPMRVPSDVEASMLTSHVRPGETERGLQSGLSGEHLAHM